MPTRKPTEPPNESVLAHAKAWLVRVIDGPAGEERRDRGRKWERHFQSVMVTLACAGIVWGVQTLTTVDKRVEVVGVEVSILQAQFARVDLAQRDIAQIRADVSSQTSRIESIERRLSFIERAVPMVAEAKK